MRSARIDDAVCLKEDIRTLRLRRGEQGTVLSIWLSSGESLYEVEFEQAGAPHPLRTLLRDGQIEVLEPHVGGAS